MSAAPRVETDGTVSLVPSGPMGVAQSTGLASRVSLLDLLDPAVTHNVRTGFAQTDCPSCGESATLFATTTGYRCDSCDAAGDVISFMMAKERLPYRQAVDRLAVRGGLATTIAQWQERVAQATFACDTARKWYHEQFLASPTVQAYWTARSFSLEDAKREMIGYAPPSSTGFLQAMRDARVPNTALFDTGLARAGGKDGRFYAALRDRLVFPIGDVEDVHAIAFAGRRLSDVAAEGRPLVPKYLNTSSSPIFAKRSTLYGLGSARDTIRARKQIIIVEGYFARLRVLAAGFQNVVAVCGTALTPDHASLALAALRDADEQNKVQALVFYDDGALEKAIAAARQVAAAGANVRIATVPRGFDDPDTYGRTAGLDALQECVKEPMDVWTAVLRQNLCFRRRSRHRLHELLKVIDPLLEHLASTKSRWDRKLGSDTLCTLFNTTREAIKYQTDAMAAPPKLAGA
jgi:DNA primase